MSQVGDGCGVGGPSRRPAHHCCDDISKSTGPGGGHQGHRLGQEAVATAPSPAELGEVSLEGRMKQVEGKGCSRRKGRIQSNGAEGGTSSDRGTGDHELLWSPGHGGFRELVQD